jgi:hypothetical protein
MREGLVPADVTGHQVMKQVLKRDLKAGSENR